MPPLRVGPYFPSLRCDLHLVTCFFEKKLERNGEVKFWTLGYKTASRLFSHSFSQGSLTEEKANSPVVKCLWRGQYGEQLSSHRKTATCEELSSNNLINGLEIESPSSGQAYKMCVVLANILTVTSLEHQNQPGKPLLGLWHQPFSKIISICCFSS